MLTITVPGVEFFDETNEVFVTSDSYTLHLEHSLVSLSKWESKFKKPFLSSERKNEEETYAYIKFMSLDDNVPEDVWSRLSTENVSDINSYIEDPMTATTFRDLPGKINREVITEEIIRHWMIALLIPLEYENRHLNKLFTLVKVLDQKNQPEKKMSRNDAAAQQRALNEERQRQYGTTG